MIRDLSSPRFEQGVEGLRGIAAFFVLYTHFLTGNDLDPLFKVNLPWEVFDISQGAVLLFFVLSGYVIGLTTTSTFNVENVRKYAIRRAIRIIPLYWFAIVLSVVVRPVDAWRTVLGNFVFLQNEYPLGSFRLLPLAANTNLWSLNYEVLYYGLFLIIWCKKSLWPVWMSIALVASVVGWQLPLVWSECITSYSIGWAFWIGGFGLSQCSFQRVRVDQTALFSLFVFWMITWKLKPTWHLFHRYNLFPDGYATWIHFSYIDFLPSCIAMILVASGKQVQYQRLLLFVCGLIPSVFVAFLIFRGTIDTYGVRVEMYLCALGVLLLPLKIDASKFLGALSYFGSISYAIYVIQRPIQWMVCDSIYLPRGSTYSFLFRLSIALAFTILLAHLSDRVVQPVISRRLRPLFSNKES